MKILHVINLGYIAGGAELSVTMLRDIQRKNGHEVRVLSTDTSGGELFSDYQIPRIATTGIMKIIQFAFYRRAYSVMKEVLSIYHPDVIHFHTTALFSPAIFFASRGTPSVVTVHGPEPYTRELLPWALLPKDYANASYELTNLTLSGRMHYVYFRYVLRPLYQWSFRSVQFLIAPSAYMAGVLRKDVPANKIVQVYNGIVLPERVPLTVYNRILFVGRLEKTKGVDYLIDAFAELASEFPDLEMQIVGDGSYRAMLEKQVRALALTNRITFLGWVKDRAQLIHEYAQATILVVPSTLPENLGTVCIEAMAVGRPIIGTNAGGIPELVSDAKTGFLVPVENSKAIAAKVRHLLTHKAELHSMEEAACIRSTDFGLDVFAQRIQKVYMEAMTKI